MLTPLVRLSLLALAIGCSSSFVTGCSGQGGGTPSMQDEQASTCRCPLDWQVDNMAVCVSPHTAFTQTLLFSSHVDSAGEIACDSARPFPQPVPEEAWSSQRIASPCAGHGTLSIKVRQGDAKEPSDDDCVIAEHTLDFDYAKAGAPQELAPVGAWSAQDQTCARAYEEEGGYLEFRIESEQIGCDRSGSTVKYVAICPVGCDITPDQPKCKVCGGQQLSNRL